MEDLGENLTEDEVRNVIGDLWEKHSKYLLYLFTKIKKHKQG